MRQCIECTLKHLGQASVLIEEAILGYPTHQWRAVGHLAEASSECPDMGLAHKIRDLRKLYEMDPYFEVPIDELITEAMALLAVK